MNTLKEERKKDTEKIAELERKLEEERASNVQEETWRRAVREGGDEMRILQLEDHYPAKEGNEDSIHLHPHLFHKDLFDWHPKPSTLMMNWSYSGKWVRVPRLRVQNTTHKR